MSLFKNIGYLFRDTYSIKIKEMYRSLVNFVFDNIPEHLRKFYGDYLINLLKNITTIHTEHNLDEIYFNDKLEEKFRIIINDPICNKNYIQNMLIYMIDQKILHDPDFINISNLINGDLNCLDIDNPTKNKEIHIDMRKINENICKFYSQNKCVDIEFEDLFNDDFLSDTYLRTIFDEKLLESEIIVLRRSIILLLFFKYFYNNKLINYNENYNFKYYNIRNNNLTYNHGEIFTPYLYCMERNICKNFTLYKPIIRIKLLTRHQLEELIKNEKIIQYFKEKED